MVYHCFACGKRINPSQKHHCLGYRRELGKKIFVVEIQKKKDKQK